ncbi:metal ABC transporter permease [Candidatus Berkiella aquae]|uniref:High-affinity zinc uptake system membrane protein ZnuB n=1 Tax=Candidatus Berkiella aquae TaxID=295108 RepID=A0A0Q9YDQ7_9GAMM|nr:metal ABC transporter permease [Candidatus Berkiella aquae]MCS5709959.1 metal ABC transporter permease [Candidatus Berkiella aquae]
MDNLTLWLPAWLAGCLVMLTHVPLGQRVLQQGVIFLDLAIAQAAGLGVIIAYALELNTQIYAIQAIALISALIMAFIFQLLEKYQSHHLEAWIGCSFVITASIGLWILSGSAHAGEHLREILMGQILWVTPYQLSITLLFYLFASILLWFNRQHFYLIFAICITATVQLVGIYLVFATLIMPALATAHLSSVSNKLWRGYGLCLFAYTSGILLSQCFDAPASPMIIISMAAGTIGLLSIHYFKRRIAGV